MVSTEIHKTTQNNEEVNLHTSDASSLEGLHADESHELAPHEPTIYAEHIFDLAGFPVTNSMLTTWIAMIILLLISFALRKKITAIPGKLQSTFEYIIEGSYSLLDQVTNNRKLSEKIFPIAITMFVFILMVNWMGLLPGVGTIGNVVMHDGHHVLVPYLRGGTADVNTTLALSLIAVICANIFGILSIGIWKTFNKFINLKILAQMVTKARKDPSILAVAPITFFVGIIEIIGEIAKVASLSFRLFGNVFAGEVLLASIAALLSIGVPIPFYFLEVLVGFIQALIFAMLTAVYFTIASHDHEHDEHEGGESEPHAELAEFNEHAEGLATL